MQIEEKNYETIKGRSERRRCLWNYFHSFKHLIDHESDCFFFWFMWFFLYYLLHLLRSFLCSRKFKDIQMFYLNTIWIYKSFKNHLWRGVFRNVNLSNLENVLQRNLRTGKAEDCILKASGGTDFEKFSTQQQAR